MVGAVHLLYSCKLQGFFLQVVIFHLKDLFVYVNYFLNSGDIQVVSGSLLTPGLCV